MNKKTDIVLGTRFDYLTVIGMTTKKGRVHWVCKCDCGEECIKPRSTLLNKNIMKSCGCRKKQTIDMLGKVFGTFTVIRVGDFINKKRCWVIKCSECGLEKQMAGCDLRRRFTGEKCEGCLAKKRDCPNGTKQCSRCKKILPIDNFFAHKNHSDKLSSYCKKCANKYKKVKYEMIGGAKKRAKNKGLEFNLDREFIKKLNEKQNGKCAYTGWPMSWDRNDKTGSLTSRGFPLLRASLDRIDSSKGYTKDNVQLVAYVVNMIKNEFDESDFIQTCLAIVKEAINKGKIDGEVLAGITSQNP